MSTTLLPPVSIVIIGRNEGERLRLCLESITAMDYPSELIEVIYVDSSTDEDGVELAGRAGVRVVRIRGGRLSAARSRNQGWPSTHHELVHFFDADTVVEPQWLRRAVAAIQRPDIACVFGRLEELRPRQSIYTRVCAFDWHIPAGPWRVCGGNSLFRKSVLKALDGFREDMIAGEEPELSYRLRQAGWTIWRLDEPMALHDLDMTRFGQYWTRAVRSGWAYAVVCGRCGRGLQRLWLTKNLANAGELAIAATVVTAAGWMWGLTGALAAMGLWMLRLLWIAYRVRRRADGWSSSLLYAAHCLFCRVPIFVGQCKGLFTLVSNRPVQLMEDSRASASISQPPPHSLPTKNACHQEPPVLAGAETPDKLQTAEVRTPSPWQPTNLIWESNGHHGGRPLPELVNQGD